MVFIIPNTDSSMIFKVSEQQALGEENDNDTSQSQLDRDEEVEEEELNSKEKVVKSAFPDTSIRKIRRLLIKHKGNPDKVIDAIYESEHKPAQNGTVETETINPNTDTDSKAAAKLATLTETKKLDEKVESLTHTQPIEDNSGAIEMAEETPNDKTIVVEEAEQVEGSQQEQGQGQELEQQQQPAAQQVDKKPKKLSAAERKKEQKRRQKENKLMKDRAKAARKTGYKQAKLQDEEEPDNSKAIVTQSMKEMYI